MDGLTDAKMGLWMAYKAIKMRFNDPLKNG